MIKNTFISNFLAPKYLRRTATLLVIVEADECGNQELAGLCHGFLKAKLLV